MEILELIKEYIKPEMVLLIPVMILIGRAIKHSEKFKDAIIPFVLGAISIAFTLIYVVATTDASGYKDVLMMIFTALTQGVLIAGASVFIHQLYKQGKELK